MNNSEYSDAWSAFCTRIFDQNRFAVKLGLSNISRAFVEEGNPQLAAPAIIVGGTNGKGETSASIACLLSYVGLRVGLFTSPHLFDFRERFRINGKPVEHEKILAVGRYVIEKYADPERCEKADLPCLTFFELTTLVAALLFRDENVDVVVWEVGLGGRLDATNAIEPNLTVITKIGFDHEAYLGHTIEQIAAEKAGLIRKEIPVVLAKQLFQEVRNVILEKEPRILIELPTASKGEFLADRSIPISAIENRMTAIAAVKQFLSQRDKYPVTSSKDGENDSFNLSDKNAWEVLRKLTWWGRHQVVNKGDIEIFLDGAHNAQGMEHVREWLSSTEIDAFFVSAMKDKELTSMFSWLSEGTKHVYYVSLDTDRAAGPEQMAEIIKENFRGTTKVESITEISIHMKYKKIAAFGSLYMVGPLLATLGYNCDDLII